jgi:hypothetical protein
LWKFYLQTRKGDGVFLRGIFEIQAMTSVFVLDIIKTVITAYFDATYNHPRPNYSKPVLHTLAAYFGTNENWRKFHKEWRLVWGDFFWSARDGASERRNEIVTGFFSPKIAFMIKWIARKQARGTKWRA